MAVSLDELRFIVNHVSGGNDPQSNRMNVLLIRAYGEDAIVAVRAARADWRRKVTLTQRNWQSRGSRRAQRNNHHDSWAIRENYVRQGNGYRDYYSLGHALIKQAIANGARNRIPEAEQRYIR